MKVQSNGQIVALNDDGKLLIDTLRLNSDDHTRFRHLMIATLRSLAKNDRSTFVMWMSYPTNLPDLSRLRPPINTKPEGLLNSYYAQRSRGELPEVY
jgi:hypothetical protein